MEHIEVKLGDELEDVFWNPYRAGRDPGYPPNPVDWEKSAETAKGLVIRAIPEAIPDPRLRGHICRCQACGEYFASVSAFDAHRIGGYPVRRCLTPEQMRSGRFALNSRGYWSTSAHVLARAAPRAVEIPADAREAH
jgi:hypothetical protein